ncbi:MAG: hypothetical protein Q7R43_03095 [Candidatus Daviesbacteria bacterium]|nr:hypothetical protein [Candidatus Daviesbacteria bacterium]
MELAEIKLGATHFLAQNVLERLPSSPLQIVNGATFDNATSLDKEQGKFRDSANTFYTLYRIYGSPEIKLEALTGLVQQLINLHDFATARHFLERGRSLLHVLPVNNGNQYRKAFLENKLGWIADYEFGFEEAKSHFLNAERILNVIPLDGWTTRERYLASDNLHWQGREACQLASVGINKSQNIELAYQKLREAIESDEEESVDQVGFGYLWLARTDIINRTYFAANADLTECENHFQSYIKNHPGRKDLLAHPSLVRGYLNFRQSNLEEAEANFQQALEIRMGGDYSKGWADALVALALVDIRRGNIPSALGNFMRAVKTNPYSAARVFLGA